MTDSEKLDALLKMVREIREYIGSRSDCPQHLWSEGRIAEEAMRQRALLGYPYSPGNQLAGIGAANNSTGDI